MQSSDKILSAENKMMAAVHFAVGDDINDFIPFQPDDVTRSRDKLALQEILNSARISLTDNYPVPPRALSLKSGLDYATYGTLGNFSLVTGKAKSKKTFLMCMVIAACVRDGILQGTIRCDLPDEKRRVVLFDTEQSKYHVWRRLNSIALLAGVNDLTNIEVYSLREHTPNQRSEIIEHALLVNNIDKDIGLVVIDGIRDLISDINDPKEATFIATKLLQWTTLANCHIITVLHQNKNDNNARGHVGTELQNKSETCISVTVTKEDKNVSLVEAETTRDKDFLPFAFRIKESGLPEVMQDFAVAEEKTGKKKGFDPYNNPPETHAMILKKIFKGGKQFSRMELVSEIKTAWAAFDQFFGDNKAQEVIAYYSQKGLIINQSKHGKSAKWCCTEDAL